MLACRRRQGHLEGIQAFQPGPDFTLQAESPRFACSNASWIFSIHQSAYGSSARAPCQTDRTRLAKPMSPMMAGLSAL